MGYFYPNVFENGRTLAELFLDIYINLRNLYLKKESKCSYQEETTEFIILIIKITI